MLSWIEIRASSLLFNIQNFKKIIKLNNKNTKFFAVVKSNAYGHGIKEIVSIISDYVDGFALNHIGEVSEIYELTDKPFLVMGAFEKEDLKQLLDKDMERIFLVVSNLNQINYLEEIFPFAKFYLKVDTGMSRLGYTPESKKFRKLLEYIKNKNLNLTGCMTHFANVEDVTEQDYAYMQLRKFHQAKKILKEYFPQKFPFFEFHTAASAATMLIPESLEDLVRVGISLYGLWPSLPTKLSAYNLYGNRFHLQPVLSWKTKIVHINEVPENSQVGYGCTYQTSSFTRIAVLPVGYNEGYDRSLSNRSYVIVRDKRAMLLGRVCMNMIMVDVTHIPDVQLGEEVILIGKQNKEEISADLLADMAGTINYEIVTRIHPSIPRIVITS